MQHTAPYITTAVPAAVAGVEDLANEGEDVDALVDVAVVGAGLCADKSGQKDKKNDVVEPVRDRANVEEREEKAEFQHEHDDYDDEYDDNHEREHFRQYQHHSSEKHTHVCEEDGYADAEPPSYQVAVGKSQKNPGY
ncbi:hypothetical protein ABEF95_006567 [Exophiala dermatitidis]